MRCVQLLVYNVVVCAAGVVAAKKNTTPQTPPKPCITPIIHYSASIMKRCTAVVLLLVATWLHASTTAAPLLFEKFDAGWEDRWQHSGSDKYGGEFEVDTPDGLDDPALKVR